MNKNIAILATGATLIVSIIGCSSSSSSSSAHSLGKSVTPTSTMPVTGSEMFAGTEVLAPAELKNSNYTPTIPLAATGLFSDSGSIYLAPGSGKDGDGPGPATIKLAMGSINVHHDATNPNLQPKLVGPAKDCVYGVTQNVGYTITGGTGAYKNVKAGGKGVATVNEQFNLPVLKDGKCDMAESAVPSAGTVTFKAVGPITRG
jgi:hypothetical protein